MSGDDPIEDILKRVDRVSDHSDYAAGVLAASKIRSDLDARVNFRVNSNLKQEFEDLCAKNHTSLSREIKRFMTAAIKAQKLI